MAELADAPDLGSGGKPWGFDSLYPHQNAGGDFLRKGLSFSADFGYRRLRQTQAKARYLPIKANSSAKLRLPNGGPNSGFDAKRK